MSTPKYPCALLRWQPVVALLALFGICPRTDAQTITNPGFEADTFTVDPGYSMDNSPITGWTGNDATKFGINPAVSSPFADNGTIPNGTKVAFLQSGAVGGTSLSSTVTGLTPDTVYKVSFRINARGGQNPRLRFSTDGIGNTVEARVNSVGGTNSYKFADFEFKATATSHNITIANTQDGDNTLVIDDFSIAPSAGKWSYRQVTGDANSGIDSQYLYSHAYTFGDAAIGTIINGVQFATALANPTIPGKLAITGLGSSFGEVGVGSRNVTGASNDLLRSFIYGGPVTTVTISNLKPNTAYVATIYGIGFDIKPFGRASTFSSSLDPSNRLSIDVDQYDQNNAIAVDYAYTTDASATPVVLTYTALGDSSFHTSAFTNREATPGTAPAPDNNWSQVAWNDDASSGLDAAYAYTHAYSFGNAAGFALNGVNFTGIAGPNPAVAGRFATSGLSAAFNNDANNLIDTGSRSLANDFLYNGYPGEISLSGLTPGKAYVLTLYSVGWEAAGARRAKFYKPALIDSPTIFDQDAFGDNAGTRFEYRYTASAAGTLTVQYQPLQNASIHTYGFSNREAVISVAPTIGSQPLSGVAAPGDTFSFSAGAFGTAPLTFEWTHETIPVPNSNSPILTLTNVTALDAGTYRLTVTNSSGSVTSDPVTLTVLSLLSGFFDTGVGPDHLALADNDPDPHYLLLVNPDGAALDTPLVENSGAFPIAGGPWVANTGTSKWIGPKFDTSASVGETVDGGAGLGVYVYRTTVDLTGVDLSSVYITGNWATDNDGIAIKVNDGNVPNPVTGLTNTAQFAALTPFTIKGGPGGNATFVPGINTIDFFVKNVTVAPGYTGLRVDGLRGLGNVTAVVPPTTLSITSISGTTVNLRFTGGVAGTTYFLDRSPALAAWSRISTQVADPAGVILFQDTSAPAGRQFYRISK